MTDQNYTTAFTVKQTPDEVFAAINNVRAWWSGDIEGSTDKLGDEFTYRYKDDHYSKQKITGFIPGKKVVWRVLDGSLNFVEDRTEWTGTTIIFDISQNGDNTDVRFTHVGLVPKLECFDACSDAWGSYINGSLRSWITAGRGQPNSKQKGKISRTRLALTIVTVGLIGLGRSVWGQAVGMILEPMPAKLETQFALSALPPALRGQATVYLLDPGRGYQRSREGTSGVACLVERTAWEMADFRNDIYVPLCYDAAGAKAHFKVIMDAAALRAQGMDPAALKAEIEKRYRNKMYRVPEKAGMSYMVAPLQRTVAPPDMKVHTTQMPHVMFYAPGITNEDIGAVPNLGVPASLRYPFIDKQGNVEQSYMIQFVGEAEKAKILADEKALLDDLCTYRDLLCLARQ
jgi:hypothetical protein